MKNGKTLTELAVELERRAANKQDIVADTRTLQMLDNKLVVNGEAKGINEIAHDQIASRVKIPAQYYDRMRSQSPALLSQNVNHWFNTQPEKRLVRTMDGNVRAFLSDRYQRIENEQIASVVLPILLEDPSIRIESCEITERRMYIKAVFPKIESEVSKGDVVQAGISITNSEVGMGSVKIEPLIFRLVCLNGLILNDASLNARHMGARIGNEDNLSEILSDEAIKADDNAILLKTRDVVRASFNQVRFQKYVDKMAESKGDKIEGNPVEAVKVLAKKAGLNEFESNGILRQLIEGADLSRYGLLNAITRTAQDVESYDRSTELETLGGNILHLARTDWQTIARAA